MKSFYIIRVFVTSPVAKISMILCLLGLVLTDAFAVTHQINIPCKGAIYVPTGMTRIKGNADTWEFRIAAALGETMEPEDKVYLTDIEWKYPGSGYADTTGGLWGGAGNSNNLTWISSLDNPLTVGTFTVSVKFKRWCGKPGQGNGAGGVKEFETIIWTGDVEHPSLELSSVTFGGGNHTLQQDDGTYVSEGIGGVRVPEIHKKTGIGIGSNPAVALEYDAPSPVCYTWESRPGLNVTFNISPNTPLPGVPAKLKVTGTTGTDTLTYPAQSVSVKGTSLTASFAIPNTVENAANKLAKKVDNTTLSLNWEVSFDNGATWQSITTTTNPLFVTAATPLGAPVTTKRMDWVTNLAKEATTPATIADKIGPDATSGLRFGFDSIFKANSLTNAWQVMDGVKADCGTLSSLMGAQLEMLGLTGIEVRYVKGRSASWAGLGAANNPYEVEPGTGRNLYIWFGTGGLGGGWNRYEGCCLFDGKWWMGGEGAYKVSAYDVLKHVAKTNVDGPDTESRQAWYDEQNIAAPYPPGTP